MTTTTTMNTTTVTKRQCRGWEGVMWGSRQCGEFNYNNHNVICRPSVGDMGWRTSIVGPHAMSPLLTMTITTVVGGHCTSPLQPIPSRWMPLVIFVNVVDCSQRGQHKGAQSVILSGVEEEEVCTDVFDCQVTIQSGVDDRGGRSSATLVRLRGRQRQAWEGGGGGAAPRGPRQQQ